MFCKNCGAQLNDGAAFCTSCGAQTNAQTEQPEASAQPVNNAQPEQPFQPTMPVQEAAQFGAVSTMLGRFSAVFSDTLFLVICILVSANAAFSLFSGSINVLSVLFTIFLWLTYVGAKKGEISGKYMRYTSGTVFATYVVGWVVAGVCALGALISLASGGLIASILSEISSDYSYALGSLFSGGIGVLAAIIFLIVGAAIAVLNYFGVLTMHKLAKSMYMSVESGVEQLEKVDSAKTWMLVFGIVYGIGALGSVGDIKSFLAEGSLAAAYIVAYVWLGKNFVKKA